MNPDRKVAQAIARRDKLIARVAEEEKALRPLLAEFATRQGWRGIPRVDVVRTQLRQAGVL